MHGPVVRQLVIVHVSVRCLTVVDRYMASHARTALPLDNTRRQETGHVIGNVIMCYVMTSNQPYLGAIALEAIVSNSA